MPSALFDQGATSGITPSWQAYTGPDGPGVYIDVPVQSTTPAFPYIPDYHTTLHGSLGHWITTGVTSIYNATPTGFRVYVRRADGGPLTPTDATNNGWSVRWSATLVVQ